MDSFCYFCAKTEKDMAKQTDEKRIFGLTKKQRSHVYTSLFVIAFLIFFFVNNSFEDPGNGPYPPNYKAKIDPASRDTAPYFELPNLDGNVVSLNEFESKVVILNFWASWSQPCRKAVPDFIQLKDEYEDQPVEIIGISLDTDTKENVPKFIEESGINYPVLYGTMSIARSYGDIQSIPTTFVLDKEGRIYSTYVGDLDLEVYREDINKLLGE